MFTLFRKIFGVLVP